MLQRNYPLQYGHEAMSSRYLHHQSIMFLRKYKTTSPRRKRCGGGCAGFVLVLPGRPPPSALRGVLRKAQAGV